MTSAQAEASKPGRSWLHGFFLSIPVALLAAIGFFSGLDDMFWPLAILCLLLSFPWNIPAGLLVGALSYPAVGHFELNGYLWLYLVCYSAIVLGAHVNGHLVFRKK